MRRAFYAGIMCAAIAACSQDSTSILVKTCMDDGETQRECECSASAIVDELPARDVARLAKSMQQKDAHAVRSTMTKLGSAYPVETREIMVKMAECKGPGARVRDWPSSEPRTTTNAPQ